MGSGIGLDWGDLHLVLEVARTGSLSAAGRRMGLNHSTVSRRLSACEARLGVRLFERLPSGLVSTEAGERMVDAAERMQEELDAASRQVLGGDARLSGAVRVAVSDLWGIWALPLLRAFEERYPEIELEIVASNASASLSRREADVAIRVTDEPPEHLIGRRLGHIASAVYGSREYLERHPVGPDGELRGHRWIGWDQAIGRRNLEPWVRTLDPEARVACRVDTGEMMLQAARAGFGLAKGPCAVADRLPELVRVTEPTAGRPLWLLTHPDLRRTARVRSFLDFVVDGFAAERAAIEGRAPRAA